MTISSENLDAVKPHFFIAGTGKCGTTSLVASLSEHPQITFGIKKESRTMFLPNFAHRFLHGTDRLKDFSLDEREDIYRNFLRTYREEEGHLIRGEGTPHYIFYPQIAERIARYCPEARLVFMLRHPTRRLWSTYGELVRGGRAVTSFEQSLTTGYLRVAAERFYRDGLSHYYRCFDRSQILVVPFEEWVETPSSVGKRILTHIGVDDDFELIEKHARSRWRPVNQPLALAANFVLNATRNQLRQSESGTKLVGKPTASLGTALYLSTRKLASSELWPKVLRTEATLHPETEVRLNEYYTVAERGLSELTGIDFERWWKLPV